MEIRSTITVFFLLLLLFTPCFSKGGSEMMDSEIYEIDYRGPETHSSLTPPGHSHGKPLHQQSNMEHHPNTNGSKGSRKVGKVDKIHG